jgi:hypothetical protein
MVRVSSYLEKFRRRRAPKIIVEQDDEDHPLFNNQEFISRNQTPLMKT